MKKNICICLLLLTGTFANAQKNVNHLKKQIIFENNIMAANWKGDFFPVLNNEVSAIYGAGNIIGLGLFYDFYHVDKLYEGHYFKGNRHIVGSKACIELLPLLSKKLSPGIPNLSLSINAYLGYNSKPGHSIYKEEKDQHAWAHYYRLNLKYYIGSQFFISAGTGIVNSNRILVGFGLKL